MDLEEFVKTTLYSLTKAVAEVDTYADTIHGVELVRDPKEGSIQFDLAVSADSVSGKKKSGGIRVLNVVSGGLESQDSAKNSTVSRVRFKINA